jgi:hypothetical protein
MSRPLALLRSLPGRIAMATLGLCGVALLVHRAEGTSVIAALKAAAVYFPFILLLEGGMLACEAAALWRLYGEDRHKLGVADLARAAVVGYPMMILLPVGRAAAEAMRAGLLTAKTSGARAAAAATRMQGVLLLANAGISVLCTLAGLWLLGPSLLPAAVAANGIGVFVLGMSILYGGRRVGIGAWLGRRSARVGHAGSEFDAHLREGAAVPWIAVLLAFGARVLQTTQYALLLVAVGGALGVAPGLTAEAIHLVGAAAGDLIPGQLGATEASYTLWSQALGVGAGSALAIALLGHLNQACWATIGSLAALALPAETKNAARKAAQSAQ